MKKLLFIMLCFSSFSCREDFDIYTIENLNNNQITVFGHGGMGNKSLLPINSEKSIEKAKKTGAAGTEIDLQLTKDGILVAFHDQSLNEQTNCEGVIAEKQWSDINQCKYTVPVLKNHAVSRLDNLLNKIPASQIFHYTFDCKLYPGNQDKDEYLNQFAENLIQLIELNAIEKNIFIESQDPSFLEKIRMLNSEVKLFIYPSDFQEGLAIATQYNLDGITLSNDWVNKSQVEEAHEAGFLITLWGIGNRKENLDAIKKFPDFIQTDDIKSGLKLTR